MMQDISPQAPGAFPGRKDFSFRSLDFLILIMVGFSEIANASKSRSVLFGKKILSHPPPPTQPVGLLDWGRKYAA